MKLTPPVAFEEGSMPMPKFDASLKIDGGNVLVETWVNPPEGNDPNELQSMVHESPDLIRRIALFDIENRFLPEKGYLMRARAWISPKQSGKYRFWANGDTNTRVSLRDENGVTKELIRLGPVVSPGDWDMDPKQRSEPVVLKAMGHYLIETVTTNWWGGGASQLAWEGPGFNRCLIRSKDLIPLASPVYPPHFRPDQLNAVCDKDVWVSPLVNDTFHGIEPRLVKVSSSNLGKTRVEGSTIVFQAGDQPGEETLKCLFVAGDQKWVSELKVSVSPVLDAAAVRRELLSGVRDLPREMKSGRQLQACGPQCGAVSKQIAFAHWGKGRVVAVPADTLSKADQLLLGDAQRLFENMMKWLMLGRATGSVLTGNPSLARWNGASRLGITRDDAWRDRLNDAAVVILNEQDIKPQDLPALQQAIANGTSLLIGFNGGLAAGLLYSGGIVTGGAGDGEFIPTEEFQPSRGGDFIQRILSKQSYRANGRENSEGYFNEVKDMFFISNHPWAPSDAQFKLRWQDVEQYNVAMNNTPEFKSPRKDKVLKLLLAAESRALKSQPARMMKRHRTSINPRCWNYVPADAPKVSSRAVGINAALSGYHPTGLYAVSGETVTIEVPEKLVDRGWKILIGDDPFDVSDSPGKMPDPQMSYNINNTSMRVVNPYGGLIYLYVTIDPKRDPESNHIAPFKAVISGAVAAPLFVLGKTSLEDWKKTIRGYPAPRSEFWGPYFSCTFPSELIRNFDDPSESLGFWNRWIATYDRVNVSGAKRFGPERACYDTDPGAWSGYPFHGCYEWFEGTMMHPEKSRDLYDCAGTLHELAHMAQCRPDRAWGYKNPYTTNAETTIGIFGAAATSTLGGRAQRTDWLGPQVYADEAMRGMIRKVVLGSKSEKHAYGGTELFPATGEDGLYSFIRHVFGEKVWPRYIDLFDKYWIASSYRAPKTVEEKRDLCLIHFSRAAGVDMSRFFVDLLLLPASPAAIQEVKAMGLPVFFPAVGGISDASTMSGVPLELDLAAEGLSFDGVCNIGKVTANNGGLFERVHDGRWIFKPAFNFTGTAECRYETISSTGFKYNNRLRIYVSSGGVNIDVYPHGNGKMSLSQLDNLTTRDSGFNDEFRTPWSFGGGYTVRLRGVLTPRLDGEYAFRCTRSSTARIWIREEGKAADEKPTMECGGWSGPRRNRGADFKFRMKAGTRYWVDVVMEQAASKDTKVFPGGWSDNFVNLWWTPPGARGFFPIEAPELSPAKKPGVVVCLPTQTKNAGN